MSKPEFDKTTPVNPPKVNNIKNPTANNIGVVKVTIPPQIVANQLKTFIPVGMAIIIVIPDKNIKSGMSSDERSMNHVRENARTVPLVPKPSRAMAMTM